MSRDDQNLLLAAIVESSNDAIIGKDLDGIITSWNPAAEKIYGYQAAEAIGKPVSIIVPEALQHEIPLFLEKIRRAEQVRHYETLRKKKDGTEIHMSLTISPIRDTEGRIIGASTIGRDITERIRAEESLRFTQTVVDHMPDAVFWASQEGRLVYINNSACERLEYDREDLLNMSVMDIVPDYPRDRWSAHWNELKRRDSMQFESRHRKKTGEVFHVEVFTSYVKFKDAEYACGIARDISRRKNVEIALQQSQERLELAFYGADLGLWDLDLTTGKATINDRAAALAGYSMGEIEQSLDFWRSIVHPDDLPKALQAIKDCTEVPDTFYESEYRIVTKSGDTKWILARGKTVERDAEGRAMRMVGTFMDVTARHEMSELLRDREIRYTNLFENIGDAVAVYIAERDGEDFVFVDFNKAAEKIEHISKSQVLGRSVKEVFPGVTEFGLLEVFQRVWKTGQSEHHPVRLYEDQRIVGWRDNLVYRLPSGELVAVYSDETERMKAQLALQDSEQMLKSILSASPIGLGLSQNRVMKWANEAWEEMFRAKNKEEYVGKSTALLYPSHEDFERAGDLLYRGLETGAVNEADVTLVRFDGSVFDANVRMKLINPSDPGKGSIAAITDISERKRMEDALRESEQRWQFALEGAGDGVWDWNAQTNTVFFSRQWKTMLDYEENEIGNSLDEWDKRVHPDDRVRCYEDLEKHFRGDTAEYLNEHRLLCKDGSYKWILDRGKVINRDSDGKPLRVIGTHTDISGRKNIENALRESEEKYRSLIQNIPVVVWTSDEFGNTTFISPNVERIFGYSPEEICESGPESWLGRIHEDDIDKVKITYTELFASGKPYNVEYRIQTKNGNWIWIRDTATGTYLKNGIWYADGVFSDISDRKRAQEELRKSEERFRNIVETSSDWIWEVNDNGLYTYISPKVKDILEYEPEEMLGKSPFDFMEQQEAMRVAQVFDSMVASRKPFSVLENTCLTKDGRRITLETSGVPFFDSQGKFLGYRGMDRDITTRKRSEDEREELRLQFLQAQKMEAVGTLASGVAHDFNNILQAVFGYCDILLMNKKSDDPNYDSLNRIKSAAQRGADLVQRLMTFSRRGDAKLRPSNLGHIVTQTKNLLEHTLPKMIAIELDLHDEFAIVNADPLQIEQILLNLAINAKDAMPQEGGKLTISTRKVMLEPEYCKLHPDTKSGPHVLVSVSDTGHGMSQETVDRIFDPFFTTKEPGKGTGLGLSIVFGIVKQHDGHINCHSIPGQGTTFDIYFPTIPSTMLEKQDSDDSVTFGGSESILLVDDEESVSETSSDILKQAGYNVLTATRARDAIALYRNRKDKIALIILDLIMPEMGGIQCLQELLKINPQLKVIFSSGMVSERSEQEAMDLGARTFLEKPHAMKKLLQVVRKVLDED